MKNVVLWDVALCRSCMNRRFGGTYRLHLQGRKIRERETSFHSRSTRRHIPEDGILSIYLLVLFFDREAGGRMLLRDAGRLLLDYTASHSKQ
jgi:hypothetical protein